MPVEACITAIICMQPFVRDSREFAFNRFSGTFIGAAWGLLFLLLMTNVPLLGNREIVVYLMMGLGVLISVYTAVAIKIPDVSGLSAIVFMCVVVRFPEIEAPHIEVARRFLGVLIGTAVAITVNISHLPREKQSDRVIFVRVKELTPDRFSQIPPAVLFQLNRLYVDGAKICLMLEHAPAFFTMQMSACHLNIPLIVMDGAAIFDTHRNRYISVESIERENVEWIQTRFRDRAIPFFTYTISNHRTCVFHDGEMNEIEFRVLKKLQRSPYRSYLQGNAINVNEIVYFKIIETETELKKLKEELDPLLKEKGLRSVIRNQASIPGISGLYIYSALATPEHAQEKLMKILQIIYSEEKLHPYYVYSKSKDYSEHGAADLLRKIRNTYEPVFLLGRLREGSGAEQKQHK